MAWCNWKRQQETKEKVDWEQAVCERKNTPEHIRRWLYESEHLILCGDRLEGEKSEPLEPVLDRMDKSLSTDSIAFVEEQIDILMMPEGDRWLYKIKTEELREAIRGMRNSQKQLIRLLLDSESKHEAAQQLNIEDSAVQSRIRKIRNRLKKELPQETLRRLSQGRTK